MLARTDQRFALELEHVAMIAIALGNGSRSSGSRTPTAPEHGAAKAGLIRFSAALAAVDGVRVNCIVPDWVATERDGG